MKLRKLLGNLGKDKLQQIVEAFIQDLEEGAVAVLEYLEEVENPEFLELEIDSEKRILSFTAKDGSHYIHNLKSESLDYLAERIKVLEDNNVFESSYNDIEERLQIGKDSEDKIYNYRKKDGTLVENVGIETNHLELTGQGMNDFQQALKDAGFNPGGKGDWSDYISDDGDSPLHISEPRCAMINIISNVNLTQLSKKGRPEAVKGVNYAIPTLVEFFDGQGNYFKKWTEMSAQGNSSMGFIKKNIALDFFDSEVGGDALKIKFGDWVPQDSFHLKAFYNDFFRCVSNAAYKLAMQVENTYPISHNRNWKRALLNSYNFGSDTYSGDQIDDMSVQVDTGARCMPDGFPVIVYQNGEFYGIFSWCIKKHRDNYQMKKSNAKHIHLDGGLYNNTIFDTIDWTQFEVRNPKDLYYKEPHNGEIKYDADEPGQFEIADETTVDGWISAGVLPDGTVITDKIKKNLQNTAKVHKYVVDLSTRDAAILELVKVVRPSDSQIIVIDHYVGHYDAALNFPKGTWVKDNGVCYMSLHSDNQGNPLSDTDSWIDITQAIADAKSLFETYFDSESMIDYYIVNLIVGDSDGFGKNWQWTTWDGKKWFVNEYDKDMSFGLNFTGNHVMPPFMSWVNSDYRLLDHVTRGPMIFIYKLYMDAVIDRYKVLRDKGIFTTKNVLDNVLNWMNRIGNDFYVKEYDKWSDCICNRDYELNPQWELYQYESFEEFRTIYPGHNNYDSATEYHEGDKCSYDYMTFVAKETVQGITPIKTEGCRDNIYRLENWISERISLEDSYLSYNS